MHHHLARQMRWQRFATRLPAAPGSTVTIPLGTCCEVFADIFLAILQPHLELGYVVVQFLRGPDLALPSQRRQLHLDLLATLP